MRKPVFIGVADSSTDCNAVQPAVRSTLHQHRDDHHNEERYVADVEQQQYQADEQRDLRDRYRPAAVASLVMSAGDHVIHLAAELASGEPDRNENAFVRDVGILRRDGHVLRTVGMLVPAGSIQGHLLERTFLYGVLSGAVEPVAALITILASGIIASLLPCLLAFAAGAMFYVVVEELIPEMSEGEHSNLGTIAFSLVFVLMMVLDVALG